MPLSSHAFNRVLKIIITIDEDKRKTVFLTKIFSFTFYFGKHNIIASDIKNSRNAYLFQVPDSRPKNVFIIRKGKELTKHDKERVPECS